MQEFISQFWDDLDEYMEVSEKLENREIELADYKAISTGFGSYPQRGGEKLMLRLRLTGGRLLPDQMKCILECCRLHHVDALKISTGQSIQLHDLSLEAVQDIMPKMWNAGIITRGSGGDYPNNVMASPLSGVEKGEYFDVFPYAETAARYLMKYIDTKKFPRKLKVSFANSEANIPHTSVRDLGFVANPDHTFQVYIAGGLGPNPKVGVLIDQHVQPKDILYYVKTMITIFATYGNYESRNRARSRYLQDTLGEETLRELFHKNLKRYKEMKNHELHITPEVVEKSGQDICEENTRIREQKQEDLYYVSFHPIGGYLSLDQFAHLYQLIAPLNQVEIRLNPEGGLYVINCNAKEARLVYGETTQGASDDFESSIACVGQAKCAIGICDSQALLHKCIDAVKKEKFSNGVLPQMNISGCISGCGSHQLAGLGFQGSRKRTENGVKPAYIVYVGGCQEQYKEKMAVKVATLLEERIPAFLVELGRTIQNAGSSYAEWYPDNKEVMENLIKKYE